MLVEPNICHSTTREISSSKQMMAPSSRMSQTSNILGPWWKVQRKAVAWRACSNLNKIWKSTLPRGFKHQYLLLLWSLFCSMVVRHGQSSRSSQKTLKNATLDSSEQYLMATGSNIQQTKSYMEAYPKYQKRLEIAGQLMNSGVKGRGAECPQDFWPGNFCWPTWTYLEKERQG